MIVRDLKLHGLMFAFFIVAMMSARADFTWTTNDDGTVTVTSYSGAVPDHIAIPSSINDRVVTRIGESAFAQSWFLKTVELPSSIATISDHAFEGCVDLENVTIGPKVTSIGDFAFAECGLQEVVIPDNVTHVGAYAFASCASATNLVLGAGLTRIEEGAFMGCERVATINIPEGVTNIGMTGFSGCSACAELSLSRTVTGIEWYAFFSCTNVSTVNFPNGLLNIDGAAFEGCLWLSDVFIPASVTNIEGAAFSGCYAMSNINVDEANSVYLSENGVLYNKAKTELVQLPAGRSGDYAVEEGVQSVGDQAMCDVWLSSVSIPSSVTNIGSSAFGWSTNLSHIDVAADNSVYRSVGGVLFDKAQTTLIQFPPARGASYLVPFGTTNISIGAFAASAVDTVTLPEGLMNMEFEVFASCGNLASISIPSTVTDIPYATFSGCTNLSRVNLGTGVTNIGWFAFNRCAITNMTVPANVKSIDDYAFDTWNSMSVFFAGDAPSASTNLFPAFFWNTTVFYLPGTAGWSNTFGGTTSILWNPVMRWEGGALGGSDSLQLAIEGTADIPITVEVCDDLSAGWRSLRACTVTNGAITLVDYGRGGHPNRFYRIRSP